MNVENFITEDQAKSSALLILLAAILILGSTAVISNIFGAEIGLNDSQKDHETLALTETTTVVPTPGVSQTSPATPKSTPTLTPKSTPTLTPKPTATFTPTATATPNPYNNDNYSEFVATVLGEAEVDAEVPLRLRGYSVVEGGVLIIAMNLTAHSKDDVKRARQVNIIITSGYAQAVAHHDNGRIDGKMPKKLRIAEVNNTDAPPKTLYVNTSLARDYYLNNVNAPEFAERYWNTTRNMSAEEEAFIERMDRGAGNVTLYNETAD